MIQGKPDTFLDVDIKNETLYNDRGNSLYCTSLGTCGVIFCNLIEGTTGQTGA
jgi:hypothetical protein